MPNEQNEQDSKLYNFDWNHYDGVAARPDYTRLFQILDDARISSGSDIRDALQDMDWSSPLRSIMSDTVWHTIAWMMHSDSLRSSNRVRFISEQPDAELLLLGAVLANDAVVLSDSAVELWSSELPNPIHMAYWEGLLDQMLLCREPLLNDRMVLCPAIVHRSMGRGADVRSYTLDLTNALAWRNDMFARKSIHVPSAGAPEHLTRVANQQTAPSAITVPLLRVDLPVMRDVPLSVLRDLFNQEPAALRRLRMAIRDSEAFSEEQLLSGRGLKELAERLDYEVAEVQNEYERLLRSRERLLASTGLGMLGLVLSVTLPVSGAAVAAALGAAAAGVNALNYVFAVRDSNADIRAQQYYLAWKALRSKVES